MFKGYMSSCLVRIVALRKVMKIMSSYQNNLNIELIVISLSSLVLAPLLYCMVHGH